MAPNHGKRFVQIVDSARQNVSECTIQDIVVRQQRGDSFTLVDVREESEFAAGHITGSIHIGKGVIERDIEQKIPGIDSQIVLYCGGGYRSALAAANLGQMGYTNVVSMDGGFRAWKEAGLAVDQ
jgi:rhodanese-related sulfurtransferase